MKRCAGVYFSPSVSTSAKDSLPENLFAIGHFPARVEPIVLAQVGVYSKEESENSSLSTRIERIT